MATNWKEPMEWDNEGTAPSADLVKKGFSGGYKPPAGVFNRFFHRTKECLKELQKKHDDNAETHILLSLDSFARVGITVGEETIETIGENMPNNSELFVSIGSSCNQSIYPASYGVMRVTKKDESRVFFEFSQKSTGTRWTGTYDATTTQKWTGWIKYSLPIDLEKYLPLIGGTLNGALKLKTQENGKTEIYKNHTPTQDYGTYINDYAADGSRARLILSAVNQAVYFQDKAEKKSYPLYGEHNFDGLQAALGTYLKSYTGFPQIGLTMGSETIESIAENLPSNSTFFTSITSGNAAIYPSQYGALYVMKKDSSRTFFEYFDKFTYKVFRGAYDGSTEMKWTGWFQYTIANIKMNSNDTTGDIIDKHLTVGSRKTGSTYGNASFSAGASNDVSGENASALGYGNVVSGYGANGEGAFTTAAGKYSHSQGQSSNRAKDVIEDYETATDDEIQSAWLNRKFALAKGESSHSGGANCLALGYNSFANGWESVAKGNCATTFGQRVIANAFQLVNGYYNSVINGSASGSQSASSALFLVGNGTINVQSTAFAVMADGKCNAKGAFSSNGADYAEYFEWADGNVDGEDRRGYFVTLDGEKIKKATSSDDYIVGVVSSTGAMIGDSASMDWQGKYLKDVFGKILTQEVEIPETVDEETGETIPAHTVTQFVVNPEYDATKEYTPRSQRQEWAAIGLLGKLIVIDDGTCQVGGYCGVTDSGTATASDSGYKVMKRIDDTHIQILYK